MSDIKLESLTPDEQRQMNDQAVKQAEVNFVNARKNYLAAVAALEALKADRDASKSGE